MSTKRSAIMARMKARRQEEREAVKQIAYVLPDLTGPAGNAFALMGHAEHLMKEHGVDPALQSIFHTEATSSGYDNLLQTIESWFTVVVPVTTYAPLEGGILSKRPGAGDSDPEGEDIETQMLQARERFADVPDAEQRAATESGAVIESTVTQQKKEG